MTELVSWARRRVTLRSLAGTGCLLSLLAMLAFVTGCPSSGGGGGGGNGNANTNDNTGNGNDNTGNGNDNTGNGNDNTGNGNDNTGNGNDNTGNGNDNTPEEDDDLSAENPGVDFGNLTAGVPVNVTAPDPTASTSGFFGVFERQPPEGCTCEWETDGSGSFDPVDGCENVAYTPAGDDTVITVTVDCDGTMTTFRQRVTVASCASDGDCDDGLFCNGEETCGDTGACVAGTDPCGDTEECNEDTDACEAAMCETDADCDDGLFCNGSETCDADTGECLSGDDPCADTVCDGGAVPTCEEGDAAAECFCPEPDTIQFSLDQDGLTGTAGDDIFSAPLIFNAPGGAQVASLQTGDSANGLAGIDLLESSHNGTLVVPTSISGIEFFDTTAFAATTFNCSNVSGIDELNSVNSTGTLSYTAIQEPTDLGLFGITDPAVGINLTFAQASTTSTGADEIGITLSAANAGTANVTTASSNGFETLNVFSTGSSANTLANFTQTTGTTLASCVITGEQNLTLQVLPNSILTYDASGFMGDLTLGTGSSIANYATFATANLTSLMGGEGDDTIIFANTLNASDFNSVSPDLGGGTDVIQASLSSAYVPANPFLGIEEWRVNATANGSSINFIGTSGITTVTNEADGTANTLNLQNVAANAGVFPTLQFRGNNTQAGQVYDTLTYTAVGNTGSSDALTIDVNNRGTALNAGTGTTNVHTIGGATLTAAGFENVTVNVADGPATFSGLTASTLTTLTVSGSSNVTLGQVDATASTIVQVTATGVSGNFSATIDELGTGASISCGSGNDTIVIGANSTATSSSVTLGAGNDTFTGDTDTDSDDVVNCGEGTDTINAGDGNDTITTGGGSDTVIYDQFTAGDESDISDFTTGSGGDVMRFDISDLQLAGGDEYVGVVGGVAVNSSEEIVILTGVGYATDELAEDAVAAVVTTLGLDMVIIYFNTADSTTHVCQDPDAAVDGAGTIKLLGNLTNITTQAAHDTLTIANIDSQA